MSDVIEPQAYFEELVGRDLDRFIYYGGPDREMQHRRLANRYGVDLWGVCHVWSEARKRRSRRMQEHGRGA
jgi:hypothetical protein